jgi:hypothetical protein
MIDSIKLNAIVSASALDMAVLARVPAAGELEAGVRPSLSSC